MGQKPQDDGKNEPSLELPSLSLRGLRRRKDRKKHATDQAADESSEQVPDEPTARIPVAREDTVAEPRPAPRPMNTPPAAPRQAPPPFLEQSLREPAGGTRMDGEGASGEQHDPGGHRFAFPTIPGRVAAVITGLVVGATGAVLTYLAMRGCEAVQGTSSCGRPGFFLLIAVLALMVLLGAVLLKAWQVTDPGSTSFLAVGVVSVVVLAILIDVIFSGWMFLIVPLVSALAYALSHWVTTRFTEPASGNPTRQEARDVDAR